MQKEFYFNINSCHLLQTIFRRICIDKYCRIMAKIMRQAGIRKLLLNAHKLCFWQLRTELEMIPVLSA